MTVDLAKTLEAIPVVPLVEADDPETAVLISRALAKGGLTIAEVGLSTDVAIKCLGAVPAEVPEMIVGAGTVLNASQAELAMDFGARFIAAPRPGLSRPETSMKSRGWHQKPWPLPNK